MKALKNNTLFLLAFFSILVFFGVVSVGTVQAAQNVEIHVDGDKLELTDQEVVVDEKENLLLPLKEVAEEFGASIEWDGSEKKITLQYLDDEVKLWLGERKYKVNGELKDLGFELEVTDNNRTVVPMEFISENFATEIRWDNPTSKVVEDAISWAKSMKGNSDYYHRCLFFVQEAYREGAGISLKGLPWRSARNTAKILNATENVDKTIPRGALVFFDWHGTVSGVYKNWGHVGIALEEGEIGEIKYIHADKVVKINKDYSRYEGYVGWAMPDSNKYNSQIELENEKIIKINN